MDFARGDLLIWLLAVPLFPLGYGLSVLRRKKRLLAFFADKNRLALAPPYHSGYLALKMVLLTIACSMLVVALARPRYGFEWRELKQKGIDIMVALDVSQSMKAEDISPNRLSRAQREIVDLLRMLKGDRIGLIAFAGVGFVQCPLTVDYRAVQMYLDHLDADLIPVPGTSLGGAIRLATKSLTEGTSGTSAGKALILITDGEDQGTEPLEAAYGAKEKGIQIFTIGMGADGGAPIPLPGGGFKKDSSGQVVVSQLDEGTLQKISSITGGQYVRSTTGDLDLERIYVEGIRGGGLQEGEIGQKKEKIFYERGHLFALLGFLGLLCFYLLPEHQKLRRPATR